MSDLVRLIPQRQKERLDPIEQEYERAMMRAQDSDDLLDLAIGLKQYREMFKA